MSEEDFQISNDKDYRKKKESGGREKKRKKLKTNVSQCPVSFVLLVASLIYAGIVIFVLRHMARAQVQVQAWLCCLSTYLNGFVFAEIESW